MVKAIYTYIKNYLQNAVIRPKFSTKLTKLSFGYSVFKRLVLPAPKGPVIKHWRKTTQLAVWMKATNEHFTITNKYYILHLNLITLD